MAQALVVTIDREDVMALLEEMEIPATEDNYQKFVYRGGISSRVVNDAIEAVYGILRGELKWRRGEGFFNAK